MSSKKKRLEQARKQRSNAARILGALESGQVSVRQILTVQPNSLRAVRIWTLLRATPRLGEKGTKLVLEKAGVWPMTRFGDLTESDRRRILHNLPERVK